MIIYIITLSMSNLINSTVNPNLDLFRKEMSLLNVAAYPDMLVYSLPNQKLAQGCIPMAMSLIQKHCLPLEVELPSSMGNTFMVKEVIGVAFISTEHLEDDYLRDLYFERIGGNLQRIGADLDKLITELRTEQKESEANHVV